MDRRTNARRWPIFVPHSVCTPLVNTLRNLKGDIHKVDSQLAGTSGVYVDTCGLKKLTGEHAVIDAMVSWSNDGPSRVTASGLEKMRDPTVHRNVPVSCEQVFDEILMQYDQHRAQVYTLLWRHNIYTTAPVQDEMSRIMRRHAPSSGNEQDITATGLFGYFANGNRRMKSLLDAVQMKGNIKTPERHVVDRVRQEAARAGYRNLSPEDLSLIAVVYTPSAVNNVLLTNDRELLTAARALNCIGSYALTGLNGYELVPLFAGKVATRAAVRRR